MKCFCDKRRLLAGSVPNYVFYGICIILTLITFYNFGEMNDIWDRHRGLWAIIYYIKTCIETIASGFVLFYIFVALSYQKPKFSSCPKKPKNKYPNVTIVYLCCDDLEKEALQNIAANASKYQTNLMIHDDSSSEEFRVAVDMAVKLIEQECAQSIQIVRRSHRVGGKPGAINNILKNLPHEIEFLLICDSDSFLPDSNFLEEALCYFNNPKLALVQFQNRGYSYPSDSHGYKILSASVDFYDSFVSFMDRYGWSPFLGHNALLRVSALKEVGGFTLGQLADDIDYSVKLRLQGYTIQYAREIVAGERHPLTYEALRRRTEKWTYGCTQILMRWGWPILKSNRLSAIDKATFFLTVGYYHFQLFLLVYLFIFYICLPFQYPKMGGVSNLILSAGLILFFTFMPSITYFARNNIFSLWPRHVVYWGFTYGSQDFVILGAMIKCLFRRKLGWLPTNGVSARLSTTYFLPEILFGTLIIAVAGIQNPILLSLPTTILFAGKFLAAPYLNNLVFNDNAGAFLTKEKTISTNCKFLKWKFWRRNTK